MSRNVFFFTSTDSDEYGDVWENCFGNNVDIFTDCENGDGFLYWALHGWHVHVFQGSGYSYGAEWQYDNIIDTVRQFLENQKDSGDTSEGIKILLHSDDENDLFALEQAVMAKELHARCGIYSGGLTINEDYQNSIVPFWESHTQHTLKKMLEKVWVLPFCSDCNDGGSVEELHISLDEHERAFLHGLEKSRRMVKEACDVRIETFTDDMDVDGLSEIVKKRLQKSREAVNSFSIHSHRLTKEMLAFMEDCFNSVEFHLEKMTDCPARESISSVLWCVDYFARIKKYYLIHRS